MVDYLTLVFALAAVGAHPNAALVLVAYSAASLLGRLPITPGGLGVVEAGLTGALAVIGVNGGAAVLATLAYRIFNYWLYLLAGFVALLLHRRAVHSPQPAQALTSEPFGVRLSPWPRLQQSHRASERRRERQRGPACGERHRGCGNRRPTGLIP